MVLNWHYDFSRMFSHTHNNSRDVQITFKYLLQWKHNLLFSKDISIKVSAFDGISIFMFTRTWSDGLISLQNFSFALFTSFDNMNYFCSSQKAWHILYGKLLYKLCQDFLEIQYYLTFEISIDSPIYSFQSNIKKF